MEKATRFTQDDLARARELFAQCGSYRRVARTMGWSQTTIRDQLLGFRNHASGIKSDKTVVPDHVIKERDRAYAQYQDTTAWICGDPLPGRSALDRARA